MAEEIPGEDEVAEEEEVDEGSNDFGISQYLIIKPLFAQIRKYKVWKYGEEAVQEMEQEETYEELEWEQHTAIRATMLARAMFLFMSQGLLAALVMSEILF